MDKMRWRYGDTNPVVSDVEYDTVIELGDLVGLFNCFTYPANECLAGSFLGVAMQRSRYGDSNPIRVATSGVFEFDCGFGNKTIGNGVSVLEKQHVQISDRFKIGKVAKNTNKRHVLIDIHSKVMCK